ncbi:MAG: glycerophosphoryl diester phosphodiesterase [Acidimicrobiales bacterium]|nr:MAG: glycerophosphoryl diester phosphodiesterase [Acidimicrobiales bacterium]
MKLFGHGRTRADPRINTLASFAWCVQAGAEGVEFDVRLTADGQPVLHHDAALASGQRISDTRRDALPPEVCGLDDLLALDLGVTLNVEIKNFPTDPDWDPSQRVTRATLDTLTQAATTDVIVSCFDFGAIDLVAQAAPGLATAMLYYRVEDAEAALDDVLSHGHAIVHPYDDLVDTIFMAAATARRLTTNVWTGPRRPGRYEELLELGVDGVITSDVEAARSAISGHRAT